MDPPQVERAIEALMKYSRAQEDVSMTPSDSKVLVQVAFKNVPNKSKHPVKLTLKHSMYPKDISICLITKDPQRYFKDLMKDEGIVVSRVIGISKLRKKFKELEAKRILCETHDVFLVDDRVIPIIPRWFGSYFYRKGKAPIKVDLTKKDLKSEIAAAARSHMLSSIGKGNCVSIPCGVISFDNEQLAENVTSALDELCKKIKPGWKNVKAVYVKTEKSASLPVYNSLNTMSFKIKASD